MYYTFSKRLIRKLSDRPFFSLLALLGLTIGLWGCSNDDPQPIAPSEVIRVIDGRTAKQGSGNPLTIDMNKDGIVDFTVFAELTANQQGDKLYVGVNPIGPHKVKSGPFSDDNFLNMGLLIAENPPTTLDFSLKPNEQWTSEHGAIAIRKTTNSGSVSHEGAWIGRSKVLAIQVYQNGQYHIGWLKIHFNAETEVATLLEYAHHKRPQTPIALQ